MLSLKPISLPNKPSSTVLFERNTFYSPLGGSQGPNPKGNYPIFLVTLKMYFLTELNIE